MRCNFERLCGIGTLYDRYPLPLRLEKLLYCSDRLSYVPTRAIPLADTFFKYVPAQVGQRRKILHFAKALLKKPLLALECH
jgi:hypothetical protein